MSIKAVLNEDMKAAMKARDGETRDTLRLLLAAIKQAEVDGQTELDDAAVEALLMKQAKQRRESMAAYEEAGRGELAVAEQKELAVIEKYLPQMMSEAEIEAVAAPLVAALGVTDAKGMGAVMGRLMPLVKGKADGRLVNRVVRRLLSEG